MWNIQLDECPLYYILLITIKTKIHNCHPLPCGGCWNPNRNQFTQRVNTQYYFVSLIGMFWWYIPVKPCLTAEFNNSMELYITSNISIPNDMRFYRFEIWALSRQNSLIWQWDSGRVCDDWTFVNVSLFYREFHLSLTQQHRHPSCSHDVVLPFHKPS